MEYDGGSRKGRETRKKKGNGPQEGGFRCVGWSEKEEKRRDESGMRLGRKRFHLLVVAD